MNLFPLTFTHASPDEQDRVSTQESTAIVMAVRLFFFMKVRFFANLRKTFDSQPASH
jgi:hypothetical protein